MGTSFVVRRDEQRLAVTLVDGKITVSPIDVEDKPAHPGRSDTETLHPFTQPLALSPGQRLIIAGSGATTLDMLSSDKATAWRSGQVVLDDTSLSNAVAEMNRYSAMKLVIEKPEARDLLVNGLFQAGDSESFANAVAQAYRLHVVIRGDEIVLAGIPVPGPRSHP